MSSRMIACCTALHIAGFTAGASANPVEVTGTSSSRVTDLNAVPNAVDDFHSFDNTTPAMVLTPTTTSSAATMTYGDTNGFVTASMGQFHSYSTAYYGNTGFNEYSTTDVRASSSDSTTVTSPTLPVGTPVTRHFSMGVSGTLTSPNVSAGGAYESFAYATFSIVDYYNSNNTLYLSYDSETSTAVLAGDINCNVGDLLTLSMLMEVTTYVSGDYLFTHPDTSTVDFSHTIQFFGDSGTPGTSLVSASGYDYTAVPEPSTLAMFGLGMISLAGCRLRKRLS